MKVSTLMTVQKEKQQKKENNKNVNNKKSNKKRKEPQADIVAGKKKGLRNRETNIISFTFIALFGIMMVYLIYFNAFKAEDVINNQYNKRIDNQASKVIRGDIETSDGVLIATTNVDEDGNETREYPYGEEYCHITGFANSSGKMGVELSENFYLLSESDNIFDQIGNDITGTKAKGGKAVTTINSKLQEAAYKSLKGNKGAVIAMEPSTGKILAMVSNPGFDPNNANEEYSEWINYDSQESVLLNRATQGLYPPGSTFKIITALEYIRENENYEQYSYDCTGSAYINGGTTIPCFNSRAHGYETLETAFANSCNSAFSTIGAGLNKRAFKNLCSTFMFNSNLPVGFEYNSSSFTVDENSGISEMQETAIGQGKTMMTPLHNLMIVSSIANKGKMMTPYMVDYIENNSNIVKKYSPNVCAEVMTEDEAAVLTEYMRSVVTKGTGSSFRYSDYSPVGKTGSAQYDESDNFHSWFVGFAPEDDPQIAICVVLEGGFTRIGSAQDAAKTVLDAYFE